MRLLLLTNEQEQIYEAVEAGSLCYETEMYLPELKRKASGLSFSYHGNWYGIPDIPLQDCNYYCRLAAENGFCDLTKCGEYYNEG